MSLFEELKDLFTDRTGPLYCKLLWQFALVGAILLLLSYGLLLQSGHQFTWCPPLHDNHGIQIAPWPIFVAIVWCVGGCLFGTWAFMVASFAFFITYWTSGEHFFSWVNRCVCGAFCAIFRR